MTYQDLAISRITPKFSTANNFKNILRFTTQIFDKTTQDVEIIRNLKNLNSESAIVLNEIGKILGVYPRPLIEIGVTGEGFLTWDVSQWDTVPLFAGGSDNARALTDVEYTRLLRATAVLTTFNGTVDEWTKLIGLIADAEVYIVNKKSSYDVVVLKPLTDFEKNLVEFLLQKVNNLTVDRDFLGTTDGGQPLTWDATPWDSTPFVLPW